MSHTAAIENWATITGKNYVSKRTVTGDVKTDVELSLSAVKTGSLTTRTDNTTGTITGDSGHGITTNSKIDLYWTGGCRRNVAVGTVSTNSIPISGGSGDNLPTANTAVKFQIPTEQALALTGNDVVLILASSETADRAQLTFFDGSTEVANILLDASTYNNNGYIWDSGNGVTSPLSGDALTSVKFSHNGTAAKKVNLSIFSN